MESIGYLGFIWGLIAYLVHQPDRANPGTETHNSEAGISRTEKASLREILEKSIGRTADLKLESSGYTMTTTLSNCLIREVDEEWALVLTGKKQKEKEKLVRIQSIRGVNLKG